MVPDKHGHHRLCVQEQPQDTQDLKREVKGKKEGRACNDPPRTHEMGRGRGKHMGAEERETGERYENI